MSSPRGIGVEGEGHQRELVERVSKDSDGGTLQQGYASPKSMDGPDGLSDGLYEVVVSRRVRLEEHCRSGHAPM